MPTRINLDPAGMVHVRFLARDKAENVADAIARDARRRCPIDTGELEGTIHAVGTRVYVGTDYWQSVEYGSRPHIIRSHGNYPLRNRETGEVFGRVVRHPGTPAQPFMRPALYQRRPLR